MRKYLIRALIVIITLSCFGCGNSSKILAKKGEEYLLSNLNRRAGIDTAKIVILAKVDTIQNQAESCLKFSISIQNKTNADFKIENIKDNIDIQLRNDSGSNILFPNDLKAFGNTGSRRENVNQAFMIEKLTINGRASDRNIIQKKFNVIPSKGRIEIFFSIIKVLKPDAKKPYELSEGVTKVPKGRYLFFLAVPIYEVNSYQSVILKPALTIYYK